jgi:hypothetical protein
MKRNMKRNSMRKIIDTFNDPRANPWAWMRSRLLTEDRRAFQS